jgi:hypothetical protein
VRGLGIPLADRNVLSLNWLPQDLARGVRVKDAVLKIDYNDKGGKGMTQVAELTVENKVRFPV